jgi:hypothetical protein
LLVRDGTQAPAGGAAVRPRAQIRAKAARFTGRPWRARGRPPGP